MTKSRAPRRRAQVLLLSSGVQLGRSIEHCLHQSARGTGLLELVVRDRLPDVPLSSFAAILTDGSEPNERLRLASGPELAWRARVVLDVHQCDKRHLWTLVREALLPVLLVGTPTDEQRTARELAEILFGIRTVLHLDPVLHGLCDEPQRALISEFLRRADAKTPAALANCMARSRRSLTRDCHAAGVSTPQLLLRFARVAQAVTWIHHFGGT